MFELIYRGGPMMWLILAASLLAATIFVERLLHLHRVQIKWMDFVQGVFNVVRRGNRVEAIALCEETPGPVARMLRAVLLRHGEPPEALRRVMEEAGLTEIPQLERNLPLLATLAQIAPMLGLAGTVMGLMRVMEIIQAKAPLAHAGDLSAGVWQALICTAAGLMVSIPAYAGYNFLVARVESIVLDMERACLEISAFLGEPPAADGARS